MCLCTDVKIIEINSLHVNIGNALKNNAIFKADNVVRRVAHSIVLQISLMSAPLEDTWLLTSAPAFSLL